MNLMTLDDFKEAFNKVKSLGWVPSKRKGPTGIGYTLEELLGLPENNIALPDLGQIELKTHRINSNSMITLFTFNRKAWKMKPLEAIRRYGTPDSNGRMGLYFTMSRIPNSTGLFLQVELETVSVRNTSGESLVEWQLNDLSERFAKKMPALILVSAFSEMRGDREWFKFERAQWLSGTSKDILRSQIYAGNILIDLRLHDKGTRARNHGTGFRVYEDKLPFLFQSVIDL
ncbi:MAG: MvaI/BcnI family restriction endonuclease [Bellilinea sp.]